MADTTSHIFTGTAVPYVGVTTLALTAQTFVRVAQTLGGHKGQTKVCASLLTLGLDGNDSWLGVSRLIVREHDI